MSEAFAFVPHDTPGELSPPYDQHVLPAGAVPLGAPPNPAEQLFSDFTEFQQRQQTVQDLGETVLYGVTDGETPLDSELALSGSPERLPQTESSIQATQALDRLENKPLSPEGLYPKETIIGDGRHIEGQQLNFVKTATGDIQLTFKLTASAYDDFIKRQNRPPSSSTKHISYIGSDRYNRTRREIMTTTADVFVANGLEVMVARPDPDWRALDGVVNITLPNQHKDGTPIDNDELGRRADTVMCNLLGVEDAFKSPDQVSEDPYKIARYAWHHKIEDGSVANTPLEKLVREEVFPGYSTIVEPGKSEDYERKHGELALIHKVASDAMLPNMLTNGLLATRERLGRGVKSIGMSSERDLATGGADSVFVRTVTEKSLRGGMYDADTYDATTIVLKPELMDRTDWYAYDSDKYGTTEPSTFDTRLAPNDLLERLGERGWGLMTHNEQMFRTGISVEAIAGVSVGSLEHRKLLITSLHESGVAEVNGMPVEDFVQVAGRLSQIIDIAHGRPPREYTPPEQVHRDEYKTQIRSDDNRPMYPDIEV